MPAKIIERVVADLWTWSGRAEEAAGDAALVEAYVGRRDEIAFAALVRRHGPMVLGVCKRTLGHTQDAEDAFQAVFWVLARKANAIRPRSWVGNWLYGVAVRTALKARSLRQRRREKQVDAMPPQPMSPHEPNGDLQALLDEEITRLPDKYRLAVVLCELEGRGRTEAAKQLGVPEGTLSSRLAHARRVLAKRLTARGVTLGAGGVAALLMENAAAAVVSQNLLTSTLQTAQAAGSMSGPAAALAKGVMAAMFLNKLKHLALAVIVGVAVLGCVTWGARQFSGNADAAPPQAPVGGTKAKPAPLAEALDAKANQKDNGDVKKSILGAWRVLRIEGRNDEAGGGGAPGGAAGPGPAGGPPGVPRGPRGFASPMEFGNVTVNFDGAEADRAYLHITDERATFSTGDARITYRVKIAGSSFDWMLDAQPDPDQSDVRRGSFVLKDNQLILQFGTENGPRPKDAKDVRQIWTLMRPPTRQEIYQRLDKLQGTWKAVAGEWNGEAFLPRELEGVRLTIAHDRWSMSPPNQPGQPDAVPNRSFGKPHKFVLDSDGVRTLVVLAEIGKQGELRILYDQRDDVLKVCWNTRMPSRNFGGAAPVERAAAAPKEFKTMAGSDLVLFKFKGEAAPKEPPAKLPGGGPATEPQLSPPNR